MTKQCFFRPDYSYLNLESNVIHKGFTNAIMTALLKERVIDLIWIEYDRDKLKSSLWSIVDEI